MRIIKNIYKYSFFKWSFLAITITIITNKTLIANETLRGKTQTIILIYYMANYEEITLSYIPHKHYVH